MLYSCFLHHSSGFSPPSLKKKSKTFTTLAVTFLTPNFPEWHRNGEIFISTLAPLWDTTGSIRLSTYPTIRWILFLHMMPASRSKPIYYFMLVFLSLLSKRKNTKYNKTKSSADLIICEHRFLVFLGLMQHPFFMVLRGFGSVLL